IGTFEFEAPVVIEAAKHAFGSRGLGNVLQQGSMGWQEGLSDNYARAYAPQWSAWVKRQLIVDHPPAFTVVVDRVREFATPLLLWIAEDAIPDQVWIPESGWLGGPDGAPRPGPIA